MRNLATSQPLPESGARATVPSIPLLLAFFNYLVFSQIFRGYLYNFQKTTASKLEVGTYVVVVDMTTPVCVYVKCVRIVTWYFPAELTSSDDLRGIRKPIARFIAYSVLKYTFAYLMGFFVACQITTVGYCLDVDGIFMIYQSYLTAIKM